ncbi:MAG: hypothetical protein FJW38_30680 [Acidobacteria bacterium]|nr:hypothetical protein [Acidobacteriota bacterium]
MRLLAEPNQVVELRLLQTQAKGRQLPAIMSGFFDDFAALAQAVETYSPDAKGTYITLNPVNAALLARAANRIRVVGKDDALTGDGDVTARRWLPIDLDPTRPSGISATDEEHDVAIERAHQIREYLRHEGWPDPILADSGNGSHLLYRVDLRPEDGQAVKHCLQALAFRFDDHRVKVDQSVFNPARIWKLYGTLSRKGDDSPERPHRLAKILEVP